MRALRAGWLSFRRLHLAALIDDWRRTLLSAIGVALGVTVVLGVLILKSELVRPFDAFGPSLTHAADIGVVEVSPNVSGRLPIEAVDTDTLPEHWDYIYEPEARYILDGLLMRYIESQVYRGAVENVASEMAARMVAMKAASDNAGKLISELQLIYNKARQAAITKELSEIVGGAAAV